MSTINTNAIDVNYPIPGKNNSSQGFRDNFTSIKNNLNIASAEISDLQNKVVLKQALANTTLNNDMGNTLISNASTLGFRATGYNLGNDLAGPVLINLSLGDVQYGNVAPNSNITINFGNWAPAGTQSNVQLILGFSDSNSFVTFDSNVIASNNNFGSTTLENADVTTGSLVVNTPYDVDQLDYRLSTIDCGTTVYIEPSNRPRKATQVVNRTITPSNVAATGTITSSTGSTTVTGVGTYFLDLLPGLNLLNSSNVLIGRIQSVSSNTSLTLTTNANVNVSGGAFKYQQLGQLGDVEGTVCVDDNYMYVCTTSYTQNPYCSSALWKRLALSSF